MCFFFIQSCEPLGKKKKHTQKNQQKKMHIIPSWALCPTCLPFLPPSPHFSSTDRNLTVASLHVLAAQINIAFLLISFVGIGESPAPCYPRNPSGIQRWPVPLEQGLLLLSTAVSMLSTFFCAIWDVRASPPALWSSWLQVQCSSWPFICQL